MAHDPNGIALTSEDVDLSVYQDAMGDGGAQDWQDYASTVQNWGSETTDGVLSSGPRVPRGGGACGTGTRSLYHPSKRMATPFVVASVVAILILIVVFFPE
jgi:hypothetical protein